MRGPCSYSAAVSLCVCVAGVVQARWVQGDLRQQTIIQQQSISIVSTNNSALLEACAHRPVVRSFQSSSCAMTWLVKEQDITNEGWPVAQPRLSRRPSASTITPWPSGKMNLSTWGLMFWRLMPGVCGVQGG